MRRGIRLRRRGAPADPVSVPCVACGRRRLSRVRAYRARTRAGRALFRHTDVLECLACGLGQAHPQPPSGPLAAYHGPRLLYPGSDVATLSGFPEDHLFYYNRGESAATLLEAHVDRVDPTILDGGAGYGHTLHALGRRYPGSVRIASELSRVCVRHLQAVGVEVVAEPLEAALLRFAGRLDVVVLSHVLEHLLDPLQALRRAHRALTPGGFLFVEVPNIPREVLAGYGDHIWIPRHDEPHLTFYSVRTLTDLITAAGFAIRFCETVGPRYRHTGRLRSRVPPLRRRIEAWLPSRLLRTLRRRPLARPWQTPEDRAAFYTYGDVPPWRLWIRCIAVPVPATP